MGRMQIVRKEVVFTGIDPLKKSQQLMRESTMTHPLRRDTDATWLP